MSDERQHDDDPTMINHHGKAVNEDNKEAAVESDESNHASTMEVNFRLDPNGRTLPPEIDHDSTGTSTSTTSSSSTQQAESPTMDYTTRVLCTHFERIHCATTGTTTTGTTTTGSTAPSDMTIEDSGSHTTNTAFVHGDDELTLLDELLFDCDIADSCLMPRTFWIDHTMQPRCNLEQMAYNILQHYCPVSQQQHCCGAEWWVQIRPAPETTSRYTAPSYNQDTSSDNNIHHDSCNECTTATTATDGISFHWDKDEDLRVLCNGTIYVHPHLSTVTYLTDGGDYAAPTFVAENIRIHNLTGEWIDNNNDDDNKQPSIEGQVPSSQSSAVSAFISWPSRCKHLCFDGRFLHAAPSNLMKQYRLQHTCVNDEQQSKDTTCMVRRRRRYTFLVNIWMYHHPFNVHPFPESMIDKMSGSSIGINSKNRIRLILDTTQQGDDEIKDTGKSFAQVTDVIVLSNDTIHISESDTSALQNGSNASFTNPKASIEQFTWPMGDDSSNETIEVSIPIDTVRSKKATGGNIRIHWKNGSSNNKDSSSLGMFLKKEFVEPRDEFHTYNKDNTIPTIDNEPNIKRPRVEGNIGSYDS